MELKKYLKLSDISKITGYSCPTISKVINNYKDVKKETRSKILKTIKDLDYEPEWSARSLRTRKTGIIGIIFKDISNPFYSQVVVGIQDAILRENKDIILFNTNFDEKLELHYLKVAFSKRVDGIILATLGTSSGIDLIKKIATRIPITIIDNNIPEIETDKVFHDNKKMAKELTRHLISHGHKKIAILAHSTNETSSTKRIIGYKEALEENNLSINENLIKIVSYEEEKDFSKIKSKVRELFSFKEKPTSIFIASTNLIIGALSYLNENRYKIPEDIALVSFDDYDFINILNPPVTTFKSINKKMGYEAASLLLKRIKGYKGKHRQILLGSDLIIRRSCGCLDRREVQK